MTGSVTGPRDPGIVVRGICEALAVMAGFVGLGLGWAELAYPLGAMEQSPRELPSEPQSEPRSEPRIWLVDGFNVLHAVLLGGRDRSEWWTEPLRRELLARVARFQALGGLDSAPEVWVVFDGPRPAEASAPPPPDEPRLHDVFAPCADDWLLERVKRAAQPERIAVVTADRRLAARVRHRGAQVVAPADFLGRCAG